MTNVTRERLISRIKYRYMRNRIYTVKFKSDDTESFTDQIEVQTYTGHSVAFNKFLYFVILWPWLLTFWRNMNWLTRMDGLSLWQVWWLWFLSFWFYRVDKPTHTPQMPLNAFLQRLSSAWVIKTRYPCQTAIVSSIIKSRYYHIRNKACSLFLANVART